MYVEYDNNIKITILPKSNILNEIELEKNVRAYNLKIELDKRGYVTKVMCTKEKYDFEKNELLSNKKITKKELEKTPEKIEKNNIIIEIEKLFVKNKNIFKSYVRT